MPGEQVKFGKVVSVRDAVRLDAANALATRLATVGVPVAQVEAGYRTLDGDHVLFLYDWVSGHFSSGHRMEMHQLGKALAMLHKGLRPLKPHGKSMGWDRLEWLLHANILPGESTTVLKNFLLRRRAVEDLLSSALQPIHNDLHLGNILFVEGRVAAFLDFEEAVHSVGNPLIDLSWVLERFCFFPYDLQKAQHLAASFLSAYITAAPPPPCVRGGIADCMRWRALNALGLLASHPSHDSAGWHSEWEKFSLILATLPNWRIVLNNLEDRYLSEGARETADTTC
jgi:Ser/Thr protein kinase RdoA (MazF antagonist)